MCGRVVQGQRGTDGQDQGRHSLANEHGNLGTSGAEGGALAKDRSTWPCCLERGASHLESRGRDGN